MFPAGIICKVDPITMLNNNDKCKINDKDSKNTVNDFVKNTSRLFIPSRLRISIIKFFSS